MSSKVIWDVTKYREENESEEHWLLRKAFMERWKSDYSEERLVCLSRVFVNNEIMGTRYPEEVMQEVAKLSNEFANEHRKLKRCRQKRTFVPASDAAEDQVDGVKRSCQHDISMEHTIDNTGAIDSREINWSNAEVIDTSQLVYRLPANEISPQIENGTINNNKTILLEAESTQYNNDKVLRMMLLMGWEGGGLGLRGDGIVEPLIGAPYGVNSLQGKGLGFAEQKQIPTIPLVKTRAKFLNAILQFISRDSESTSVTFFVILSEKESKSYRLIIRKINRRVHFTLSQSENVILNQIKKIMDSEVCMSLSMNFKAVPKECAVKNKFWKRKKQTRTMQVTLTKCITRVEIISNKQTNLIQSKFDEFVEKIEPENFQRRKGKQTNKLDEFKINFCTSLLSFVTSEDESIEICFPAILSEIKRDFIRTVCECVSKRVVVPFASVTKLCTYIAAHTEGYILNVQFESKQTRTVFLRKLYCHKASSENKVEKCVVNKPTNTKIPDKDNTICAIIDLEDEDIIKGNNNRYTETNKLNAGFFERVDKAMLQLTIDSLTSHHKNLVEAKLHNKEKITKNSEKDINENIKYRGLSASCDTLGVITVNSRKWYELSEKFLKCDNLVENTLVKNIDSDYNINKVNNIDLNGKEKYETCATTKYPLYKAKSNCEIYAEITTEISNQKVDKLSELDVTQLKGNIGQYLKPVSVLEACSDNKILLNLLESKKSYQAVEKHAESDMMQMAFEDETNNENVLSDCRTEEYQESHLTGGKHTDLDIIEISTDDEDYVTFIGEFETEASIESRVTDQKHSELDKIDMSTDNDDDETFTRVFETEESEESHQTGENHSEFELNETEPDLELTEYKAHELGKSSEAAEQKPLSDIKQVNDDIKIDLKLTINDGAEELQEFQKSVQLNFGLDVIQVKTDHNEDLKLGNDNNVKYSTSNKTITKSNKNCHDIILIDADVLEVVTIHKKVQNAVEKITLANEFLPLFKFHGVLDKGLVYSCHNRDTCIWLKGVLSDYNIIDYKNSINNHKLKINITSSNSDAKKFFDILQIYNRDLKCCSWKIISKEYYRCLLTIYVEMDDASFEYICDNNFSLSVGYAVAQFSIGL